MQRRSEIQYLRRVAVLELNWISRVIARNFYFTVFGNFHFSIPHLGSIIAEQQE